MSRPWTSYWRGQPLSYEHTLINLLRDVEPLMGY